jgi:hypothetical protein
MEIEIQVRKRFRIGVSTSVKGIKTYDCTVDWEGATMEDVLSASDALVAALDKRYPSEVQA